MLPYFLVALRLHVSFIEVEWALNVIADKGVRIEEGSITIAFTILDICTI